MAAEYTEDRKDIYNRIDELKDEVRELKSDLKEERDSNTKALKELMVLVNKLDTSVQVDISNLKMKVGFFVAIGSTVGAVLIEVIFNNLIKF